MYVTAYKLNNSYTTYVVKECDDETKSFRRNESPRKSASWNCGATVKHWTHGKGIINRMDSNHITVCFDDSKIFGRNRLVQITFTFQNSPREIDALCLCQ